MKKLIKHKLSRQAEAIELASNGFSYNEIAEILCVHRSTVSRYFSNPTTSEVEDFYENSAYGAYYTKDGRKIPFNRRYKPLEDKTLWVKNIVRQEWYYQDMTPWPQRFHNSQHQVVVYSQDKI